MNQKEIKINIKEILNDFYEGHRWNTETGYYEILMLMTSQSE